MHGLNNELTGNSNITKWYVVTFLGPWFIICEDLIFVAHIITECYSNEMYSRVFSWNSDLAPSWSWSFFVFAHKCYECVHLVEQTQVKTLRIIRVRPWMVCIKTHWGMNKMATNLQTTFSSAFIWKNKTKKCLISKFPLSLFVEV